MFKKSNITGDGGLFQNKSVFYQVISFLKKLAKHAFIDAFTGMAQGLFVTLIAGTMIKQLALFLPDSNFKNILLFISRMFQLLMGAGIGVGIAVKLKAKPIVIAIAAVAGFSGAFAGELVLLNTKAFTKFVSLGLPGNPISAYVVSLLTVDFLKFVAGKTKLDILLVPLCGFVLILAGIFLSMPFIEFVKYLSLIVEKATEQQPAIMGIVISMLMGIFLTMPTSSAAIWVAVAQNNTSSAMALAGGAAAVGCAAHMITFAVISYRVNGFSGLISQGIGTSMLQIPNIMRKPAIMIPAIISSIVVGPMSTVFFQLRSTASGGGMGTAAFVGVIETIGASKDVMSVEMLICAIALLFFVIPMLVGLASHVICLKLKLYKEENLKLL